MHPDDAVSRAHAQACADGRDSYVDPATGFSVFTAEFLTARGHCCGSGCRHCPYRDDETARDVRR